MKEGSESAGHLSLFSEQDGEPLERFEQRTESDLFYQEFSGFPVEKAQV